MAKLENYGMTEINLNWFKCYLKYKKKKKLKTDKYKHKLSKSSLWCSTELNICPSLIPYLHKLLQKSFKHSKFHYFC